MGGRRSNGRGEWIRTTDPLLPKQVRYQAALRPDWVPRRPATLTPPLESRQGGPSEPVEPLDAAREPRLGLGVPSQAWGERRVPTVMKSACPLDCPDACSLEVRTEAGRIASIGGSRINPLTGGYICAKVRRFAEHVYSADRL